MGGRWNSIGFQFFCFLVLINNLQGCWSLNLEGMALLEFRTRVISDPFGVFSNWNKNDSTPCLWSGVRCLNGKVQMLDMKERSLEGTLAPDLGKLSDLRFLVLQKNHFSGVIPKELGELTKLELLDLSNNKLSGIIPVEISRLPSLKRLLLGNNKFEGSIPLELSRFTLLSELQFDDYLTSAEVAGIRSNLINVARRKLLEQSSNLAAEPATVGSSSDQVIALPTSRSSGTFPAIPTATKKHFPGPAASPPIVSAVQGSISKFNKSSKPTSPAPSDSSESIWKYFLIIPGLFAVLIIAAAAFFTCQTRAVRTIRPWRTGLSGQLQKAFVTGVPKLNRLELDTACEDFSNIIDTQSGCTIYKGTLSSGVEIAVAATAITSSKDWLKSQEMAYRKQVDTLSRINHKNFVNLIGYCEDDEPFNRMMVFEYAPNGTVFEHLHIKEMDHLDWNARMRIIMGTAYCLQYMHHELNPPVAHSNLSSHCIYLTDDYAAKVAEICFTTIALPKSKVSDDIENSVLPPLADPETNIYSFGILMLEIISGKLPYCEEKELSIEKWAADYLNEPRNFSCMIDPSLKSFKQNELEAICEVIKECIKTDLRQRPTMNDIVVQLRQVINISPEQAVPRLSPLWWAELEILSAETT
ncbi:protein MALE DISCOVERER 2 [Citrus sinensis]|nr:protein MALE DISCOVERER 2 [Citrus sinensis]